MTVRLTYFAVLREQRGLSNETVETEALTYRDLYESLRSTHNFSLPSTLVTVAVDGAFVPLDSPVSEGAEVVFIPPVAGG